MGAWVHFGKRPKTALINISIKRAKARDKAYKVSDSGGLFLWVTPIGGRIWRWAFRHDGKQKLTTLENYPDVPLALAMDRHSDDCRLLVTGVDPMAQRKAEKTSERVGSENSFASVTAQWLEHW